MDRRSFLQFALGASVVGLGAGKASRAFASPRTSADLVLKNGPIVTMDQTYPVAEALAVRSGRILAVGPISEIEKTIGHETQLFDLNGQCVSPGIIDAHSHIIAFGQMELNFVNLRPPKVDSIRRLQEVLAHEAGCRPKGEWIVGRGFKDISEGRFPDRRELDTAVPDHPVLIIHWGGQFGAANTLALKKAGLFRTNVQDPYGGKYLRDKDGLPNGILIHYAAIYSVYRPPLGPEGAVRAAAWAAQRFAEVGVTCVHDNFVMARRIPAYVQLESENALPMRLRVYPYAWNLRHCELLLRRIEPYESPLVRLQGIKLAIDGYPLMYKPLIGGGADFVASMHPKDQFDKMVQAIHRAGLQVDVHAVGDKGVDWTLEAFRKAAGSAPECRRRRHRIEHFPFRKMDSIRRAAELGVPVCTQPLFITVRGDHFLKRVGPELTMSMVPSAALAAEGVRLCFGADVPAFPSHRPLDTVRIAMERKTEAGVQLDPSERLTFIEALKMHTIDAAYAAFDENELGSLEKGKYADFVIWNKDLRMIEKPADLENLRVKATYVGGRRTFYQKS